MESSLQSLLVLVLQRGFHTLKQMFLYPPIGSLNFKKSRERKGKLSFVEFTEQFTTYSSTGKEIGLLFR